MNQNLLRLGELEWPVDPKRIFGRGGPFVMEIGFGNGQFLAELSSFHPEWNLLGVEIAPASITRAYLRARREGLANIRVLHGQARFAVRELCPPRSLHRVFVNFPDPWPREKHQDRRLMQQPFLRLLSTRLEDGGALLFTTDHEEYFRFALAEGEATGLYAIREGDPSPEMLRTKYAQRWLGMRKPIYHAAFLKARETSEPHPASIEVVTMQHIRLRGDLKTVASFEKAVHPFKGGRVILRNCYRGLEQAELEFFCLVDEEDLRQQVVVEARPGESGVTVELSGFGAPVVTRGVKESVHAVANWLVARGMEILEVAV
ncbi:MAG TPA: tRNA (guanosine(46)-N7)-methyltransferase TrmB [Candidatus Krumholzibacteria bacterium]|nr:tRNA (guanosine(46)-N7)-methyltransferase TrmB [Candidatus Krumholzibacteria bacterium]